MVRVYIIEFISYAWEASAYNKHKKKVFEVIRLLLHAVNILLINTGTVISTEPTMKPVLGDVLFLPTALFHFAFPTCYALHYHLQM